MTIKRLVLKDFRNYDSVSVDFDKGVNIIYGNKTQGKTNLLEAIYFCSIGKSVKFLIANGCIGYIRCALNGACVCPM